MLLSVIFGAVVGLSLGLTGGGGSILAVPLLLYGLGFGLRRAVALSLAVVGLTALYGAVLQTRQGNVFWKAGVLVGVGGILGAPLGAWLGGLLPEEVALYLFAGLMVLMGALMIRKPFNGPDIPFAGIACDRNGSPNPPFSWTCAAKLGAAGVVTGLLAGAFGVGGGFLVVPALLLVLRVGMPVALATSLVSIVLVAASGLVANAQHLSSDDWLIGGAFTSGAAVGMTLGLALKKRLPAAALSRIFGGAIIGAGVWVIVQTLLGH